MPTRDRTEAAARRGGAAVGIRVAFQGEAGAFSEEAIRTAFGEDVAEAVPQREFADIARAVQAGSADLGLLPIENSIAGAVAGAYDVLAGGDLRIVAEVVHPIRLCLLGVPGAMLARVRRVLSHPVALAQCTRFLSRLESAESIAIYDTAGAARDVRDLGDPAVAAVAGRVAAARYGLDVLAADIQDRPDNQTRFFLVAAAGTDPLARGPAEPCKTALLFETEHRAGALVEVLVPFAEAGISLTCIASRPAERPWHYRFFVELEADAGAPVADAALREAAARARSLKVLGTFHRLG